MLNQLKRLNQLKMLNQLKRLKRLGMYSPIQVAVLLTEKDAWEIQTFEKTPEKIPYGKYKYKLIDDIVTLDFQYLTYLLKSATEKQRTSYPKFFSLLAEKCVINTEVKKDAKLAEQEKKEIEKLLGAE